mgnify:FL=1
MCDRTDRGRWGLTREIRFVAEMDQFPFMHECLKEFNYPNIHGMDEE